jgi:hypothetical protein
MVAAGTYQLPPPADLAHFDPYAYLATATGLMRDLQPDAELVSLTATQVLPDATMDLAPQGSQASYWFRSRAGAKVPAGQLAGRALPCVGAVSVAKEQIYVQIIPSTDCGGAPITTKCSIKHVLDRAHAQGAPTNRIARVSIERRSQWIADKARCAALKDTEKQSDWRDGRCEIWLTSQWVADYYPQGSFAMPDACGGP